MRRLISFILPLLLITACKSSTEPVKEPVLVCPVLMRVDHVVQAGYPDTDIYFYQYPDTKEWVGRHDAHTPPPCILR